MHVKRETNPITMSEFLLDNTPPSVGDEQHRVVRVTGVDREGYQSPQEAMHSLAEDGWIVRRFFWAIGPVKKYTMLLPELRNAPLEAVEARESYLRHEIDLQMGECLYALMTRPKDSVIRSQKSSLDSKDAQIKEMTKQIEALLKKSAECDSAQIKERQAVTEKIETIDKLTDRVALLERVARVVGDDVYAKIVEAHEAAGSVPF